MDYISDEESEISDSEILEYKEKPYELLRTGKLKLKGPNGNLRCPFCAGKKKQDYKYKDLLQHATGAGKGSSNRGAKQKANHLALAEYLETDLADEAEQTPRVATGAPAVASTSDNNLYCVPWTAIVVNIVKASDSGRDIFIKEYLMDKFHKYNPRDIVLFWDSEKETGQAIIKFDNDWTGFRNAFEFEKSFEVDHRSKKEWVSQKALGGQQMYGWFAKADDYESVGVIGDYLRNSRELKTVSDTEKEESQGRQEMVANLVYDLDMKTENLDDLQIKYNEKNMSLCRLQEEIKKQHIAFLEDTKKLQHASHEQIKRVLNEQEMMYSYLETKRKELDSWNRDLNKRETLTERERQKLNEEKNKNNERSSSLHKASIEQTKANENVLRLMEEHQRENKEAMKKILDLERQLDATQQLEMDIQELKGKLQVMKHLENEDDEAVKIKMEEMAEELEDKEEQRADMESLNQTLLTKERQSNDELQKGRQKLIEGLKGTLNNPHTDIWVKRMGEIDVKAFQQACKERFSPDEADIEALELCTLWQDEKLTNPNWHPFKIVTVEGNSQEIIDADDEMLRNLKDEWGNGIFDAVCKALLEMNDCNPSGRYVVSEFWNTKEDRKATMKEVISYMMKNLKTRRRR